MLREKGLLAKKMTIIFLTQSHDPLDELGSSKAASSQKDGTFPKSHKASHMARRHAAMCLPHNCASRLLLDEYRDKN
jgi:hypothetical protein